METNDEFDGFLTHLTRLCGTGMRNPELADALRFQTSLDRPHWSLQSASECAA